MDNMGLYEMEYLADVIDMAVLMKMSKLWHVDLWCLPHPDFIFLNIFGQIILSHMKICKCILYCSCKWKEPKSSAAMFIE